MELHGKRTLIVGATGVLGGKLGQALHERGARLMLSGRDPERLARLSRALDDCPTEQVDLLGDFDADRVVDRAVDQLGGLDLLVVTVGVAAFGPAEDTDPAVRDHLLRVNTTAPMALIGAALHRFDGAGTVAALSAILADYPTAQLADYSASKSALSAWLQALRHEQRRSGLTVFDIRPPHMDTGLVDRAIAGTPPRMPPPADPDEVVDRIVQGLCDEARELRFDLRTGEFALR